MFDPVLLVAIFVSFAASLFGLVVGSFANVVIHRLPREESIVFPSSRCPHCGAAIRPWQNIPVLSWLFLRGRCASCREPISPRYPAVELLHGLGFGLVVWTFGPEPFTPLLLLFFFALVVLAFIDWDHQILPNVITLPGILVGLLGSLLPERSSTGGRPCSRPCLAMPLSSWSRRAMRACAASRALARATGNSRP